jgi:hypothetical protein
MKILLNIEPDGHMYGFPREIPHDLIKYVDGDNYELKPEVRKWASDVGGYPPVNGKNVKFYHWMEKEWKNV